MIIGILILVAFFLSFAYMKREKFLNYIIIGTLLRLLLIGFYFIGVQIPESGGDAKNFFYEGRAIFDYLFFGGDKIQVINPYSNVIGFSMVYSGDNIRLALLMNTICYIVIAFSIYEIVKLLTEGDRKAALKAVIIITFFPIDILYSAVLLREQTIIMFLILSFWFLLRYIKKGIFFEFLISVLFHVLAVLFHSGILFLLAVHLYVLVFYRKKVRVVKFKAVKTIAMSILGLGLFKILVKTQKFAFLKDILNIEYLNHVVVGRFLASTGTGRTVYLMNLVPTNLGQFILYLPIRIVYFLFAPFIWMIGGAADIFVLVDGGLYLILIFFAYRGLKELEPKIRKAVLIYFFAFSVVFSIGTTNYGTAMRHRHKILWLITAVAVIPKRKLAVKREQLIGNN